MKSDFKAFCHNQRLYRKFQELAFDRGLRWASQASTPDQKINPDMPTGIIVRGRHIYEAYGATSLSSWEQSNVPERKLSEVIADWSRSPVPTSDSRPSLG